MQYLLIPIIVVGSFFSSYFFSKETAQKNEQFQTQLTEEYQEFKTETNESLTLGGDSTAFVGGQTFTLSGSGITSSASSIGLNSFNFVKNDGTTQEYQTSDFGTGLYLTIEPGNRTRQEFIQCTTVTQGAGTSAVLSGCSRGMSPITPYTASSSLRFPHSGGSQIIISDTPQFWNNFLTKNNDEDITGIYTFNANLPTSNLLATQTNQFVTQAYVIGTVLSGAATATESTTGIARAGTALQSASSTASTANTPLFMQPQNATSSKTRGCATGYSTVAGAGCVPVAQLDGYLKKDWTNYADPTGFTIGSTTATSSFSVGSASSPASTTYNGIDYKMPLVRGASSTVLTENGGGVLRFLTPQATIIYKSTGTSTVATSGATTTATTVAIPANAIGPNGTIRVTAFYAGVSGNVRRLQMQWGNGSASTTIMQTGSAEGTNPARFSTWISNINATNDQTIYTESVTLVGFQASTNPTFRTYTTFASVDTTAKSYIAFQAADDSGVATGYKTILVELLNQN